MAIRANSRCSHRHHAHVNLQQNLLLLLHPYRSYFTSTVPYSYDIYKLNCKFFNSSLASRFFLCNQPPRYALDANCRPSNPNPSPFHLASCITTKLHSLTLNHQSRPHVEKIVNIYGSDPFSPDFNSLSPLDYPIRVRVLSAKDVGHIRQNTTRISLWLPRSHPAGRRLCDDRYRFSMPCLECLGKICLHYHLRPSTSTRTLLVQDKNLPDDTVLVQNLSLDNTAKRTEYPIVKKRPPSGPNNSRGV
ncbi:hypothetical protein HOY82DRAFT_94292 [Tuber indicum]|nr:hypothetical protein HOY82DRAFT_94292 [Tuber indicum]